MASWPEPEMSTVCPPSSTTSPALKSVNQLTLKQERVSQRTEAGPLSILELQSVDEKSQSAVTKLGSLPRTLLTTQSWEEGGSGRLPGRKQRDC